MNPGDEQEQLAAQIEQLESVVKTKMTKQAIERYGNVKIAHPEKAVQAMAFLAQMLQTGNVSEIDDNQLKALLRKLSPEKKEFNIKRR